MACFTTCVFVVANCLAAQENLAVHGDFESAGSSTDPARPAEFWHRVGGDYLAAYPDWRRTEETPASGRWCVTTSTGRELTVCGEGSPGALKASVSLKASQPGTRVRLRLSWWRRLRRMDETAEVTVGPQWQSFAVETEARQGGPVEAGVSLLTAGEQLWADEVRIVGTPCPEQVVEPQGQDAGNTGRPTAGVSDWRTYGGDARDQTGRVPIRLWIPEACVEVPYVSGGVPFPRGRLFRHEHVRVLDAAGREAAMQVDVLARWLSDQSIKVLLVTLPRGDGSGELTLGFGPDVRPRSVGSPLEVAGDDGSIEVRTGTATFRFVRGRAGPSIDGVEFAGPSATTDDGVVCSARACSHRVELSGPLRAMIAADGRLVSDGRVGCGRFVTRYEFWRGSGRVRVSHTWINDEPRRLLIRSADFVVPDGVHRPRGDLLTQAARSARFSTSGAGVVPPFAEHAEESRHDGLFGRVAVRDFWQNHPCGAEAVDGGLRIWLWPPTVKGVIMAPGMARQWEFLLETGGQPLTRPFRTTTLPLLASPPEWNCASGVFEFLLPPDPETFPVFEKRVGTLATLGRFSAEAKERSGHYGVFDYGDAPGDGGWANLESMAAHELFLHWLQTGSREHFDMARLAAEHYRDVDIHHGAGFCHTHCNNHVFSGESWSHSWIQGVRDLYFLLGDLRALDVLREVGDRLLAKPVGWTSGRDWTRPIDNLVDIAGATGDPRYLACARRHIEELGRRQVPGDAICGAERGSWYEDRYEAGCAFTWYGCQAMAKLHHETADADVLDVLRREMDISLDVATKAVRSHVVLPGTEVSADRQAYVLANPYTLGRGSTLFPPLGYLAATTGERRYLDLGMRILAHYMLNLRGGSDASATSYATVFLHYAKSAGIGAKEERRAFAGAKDFSFEQWPEALANGGFEADHFAGWSVKRVPGQDHYYDSLVKVGYYLDQDVRHGGRRSLRFHSDNRSRRMSVEGMCRLRPRMRWRASLWMKSEPAMKPGASVTLREYDEDRSNGVPLRPVGDPVAGWQKLAGELTTVTRSVARVSLVNGGGTGDLWFDDVSIQELGRAHALLTDNGAGRDWRLPAYPGLGLDTGGSYAPDEPMSGDVKSEGRPIRFTEGCLTDGVSKYSHLQKPIPSYAYWTGRPRGSIRFDLGRAFRIRTVRVNVLNGGGRGHGTRRIELRLGNADGAVLAAADPAADGWNVFDGLDAGTRHLALVLTTLEGARYTTLSEVEIWGEAEE